MAAPRFDIVTEKIDCDSRRGAGEAESLGSLAGAKAGKGPTDDGELRRERRQALPRLRCDGGPNRQAVKCLERPGTPLTRIGLSLCELRFRFAIFRAPGRHEFSNMAVR